MLLNLLSLLLIHFKNLEAKQLVKQVSYIHLISLIWDLNFMTVYAKT